MFVEKWITVAICLVFGTIALAFWVLPACDGTVVQIGKLVVCAPGHLKNMR
jgi:hypothetical protein